MQANRLTFEQSPTLRALLVYFDPAPRPALLASLAGLGVFVSECIAPELQTISPDPPPDIVIACGLRYDRDRAAIALLDRLESVLIVAAEKPRDIEMFRSAGFIAALIDPATLSLPFGVIADAAARCRARGRLPAASGGA